MQKITPINDTEKWFKQLKALPGKPQDTQAFNETMIETLEISRRMQIASEQEAKNCYLN